MARAQLASLLRDFGTLIGTPRSRVPDAELLERFVSQRDEAAFELLVWRHERMVLGLCRRMLRHQQDAEDACQATFLALACKCGSIGKREAVASWLYKVAYRIALRARSAAVSRRRHEQLAGVAAAMGRSSRSPCAEVLEESLREVLHEEVERLPKNYRGAVVLCYLEGLTNEQAALQLRCPTGTVVTRLARARQRLRRRLTRRGLAISTAALAVALTPDDVFAAAPAAFRNQTLKAALVFAMDRTAGGLVGHKVTLLARGVLRTMMITKVKLLAAILLSTGLIGTGTGVLAHGSLMMSNPTEQPDREVPRTAVRPAETNDEAPATSQQADSSKPSARKADKKSDGVRDSTAKEVVKQSFRTGQAPRVIVELYNGNIDVQAGGEGAVQVQVTKQGRGKTEEAAQEALKTVDVKMTQEGETVRVKVTRTEEGKSTHSTGASAELKVPAAATLELHSKNGSVRLTGGTGKVQARTSNGTIQADNSKGPLDLQTSNGAVAVTGATGRLELKTNNGAIRIQAEKAVASAKTSNGPVEFRGTLAGGKHALHTTNGSIVVNLPGDASFEVDAQTSRGKITSEFANKKTVGNTKHWHETVGQNPTVILQLHTSNGNITVRPQGAKE
jgi:RNA polymerase sigma factor (sigma-70 family)